MAWTYTGNPAASDRDNLRFTLGDVKQTPQSLTDEEVQFLLSEQGYNVTLAAIDAAEAMSARYSGLSATSKKVGDLSLSVDYGATASRFDALAARLRRKSRTAFLPVISSEQEAEGVFSIGMDDYAD